MNSDEITTESKESFVFWSQLVKADELNANSQPLTTSDSTPTTSFDEMLFYFETFLNQIDVGLIKDHFMALTTSVVADMMLPSNMLT